MYTAEKLETSYSFEAIVWSGPPSSIPLGMRACSFAISVLGFFFGRIAEALRGLLSKGSWQWPRSMIC
jgi:hypothetical protein